MKNLKKSCAPQGFFHCRLCGPLKLIQNDPYGIDTDSSVLALMLASYLSVDSVQRQVAVMTQELHYVRSQCHPSCRPVAQQFFLHQLEGLIKTWTTYRDSLLSTLDSFSLINHESFEPGSVARHDLLHLLQETRSHTSQAHHIVLWLLSLHMSLLS